MEDVETMVYLLLVVWLFVRLGNPCAAFCVAISHIVGMYFRKGTHGAHDSLTEAID